MANLREGDTGGRQATGVAAPTYEAPDSATLVEILRLVVLSRSLDDAEARLRKQGRTYFYISSAGHELIQATAAQLFRPGYDWFYLYYRDRCLSLGLGVSVVDQLRQAFAKVTDGTSGGREMPCHFGTPALRIVNQSSATGSQFLHAVGTAEGIAYARRTGVTPSHVDAVDAARVEPDEIVLTCGGDGATSEGEFYEAISAACLKRLPVVFLIEDNGYAISVPVEYQTPGANISQLFRGFPGLLIQEFDGTDVVASYRGLGEAVRHVRSGRGPALVHAHVERLTPHSDADNDASYRPADERRDMRRRDPLTKLESLLLDRGHITEAELRHLKLEITAEVDRAVQLIENEPEADATSVERFLFSPVAACAQETPPEPDGKSVTLLESIRETMALEMRRDDRILVFGEDVADVSRAHLAGSLDGKGGVFRLTQGLQREFGPERVFNTPIAEAAIVGRALGLAARGLLPIAEIQFFDYIWPAMHQIRNELAVLRWRSFNNFSAPVVLRVPIGGYLRGGGMYHSQSAESIFCSCPGLRVIFPSNAQDAAGLLRAALRCGDPTLFLEHKHLYRQPYARSPYPGPDYVIPLGKARRVRRGTDVTVITYGAMVEKCRQTADALSAGGVEVEIIDLRCLVPYDWDAVSESVRATHRALVVTEEPLEHGFGAEIAARIGDDLFGHLDAPVRRVGALNLPVPYAPVLEEKMLPGERQIEAALRELVAY